MMRRIGLTACALLLLLATGAAAQTTDVKGTIASVEPRTGVITFTDGRVVHVEPGALVWIGGHQGTLAELKPGTTINVKGAQTAAAASAPRASAASTTTHPPVDTSGTVARFDPQTRIVIFEDGRSMRITERTTAWQAVRPEAVQPGTHVFLDNAVPAGFQSASGTWQADQTMYMGTVARVDADSALIVLDNGSVVRVSPATKMQMGSQTLTLAQLEPGDQLVIRVKDPAGAAASASPSALPRQGFAGATIEADEVIIIRRPQAP